MAKKSALNIEVTGTTHIAIQLGDQSVDAFALRDHLEAIAAGGTMQSAARAAGVTYRTLWGRIEMVGQAFGQTLVEKSPGVGTQLSPFGQRVRAALRAELPAQTIPAAQCAALLQALTQALGRAPAPVRVVASHDFALARACAQKAFAHLDLHNAGSDDALRALVGGSADLAGFHTSSPTDHAGKSSSEWLTRLRAHATLWVEPVMEREQGLLIAKRNPLRVRTLADLARPGVRFVNRQRGSGTRALFDVLLQNEGVRASAINGYAREEFTHEAVAAMIAADAADAGMGLRAAAAQFKLGFIPLGREVYFLAGKATLRGQANTLMDAMKVQAKLLPGYRAL
jgi:putative molybdopterin biosynthesis protein